MGVVHLEGRTPEFSWNQAAVVLEVHNQNDWLVTRGLGRRRTRKRDRSPSPTLSSRSKRRKTSVTGDSFLRPASFAHLSTRAGNRRSESLEVRQQGEGDDDDEVSPYVTSSEGSSLQESESDIDSEYGEYVPPRSRVDVKLRQWAAEVFRDAGNRRHVIGIHASAFDIRFYFYDRAGLVFTEPLQIQLEEDAAFFVSAVISLSMMSPIRLGLDPFFAPNRRTPYHSPGLHPPLRTQSTWADLNETEGAIVRVDGVDFVIEDLITATGLYGRGTTIFGVRPAAPPDNQEFSSPAPPSHPSRTRTRHAETSVPHSHPTLASNLAYPEERLVLKLAWQVPSRQSEDELLKLAQEKGVEGVIKLYKSATLERLSEGFRGRLVPKKMYVDRELRVQVLGPRCIPLKRVSDTEDFKEAFRSLVRGT